MADPIPKYPLYDSTYTAYRLSPLYHGANILLEETTLRMHARRLRDILRGDILRGVDVGAGNADGGSGILESCTWDLIGDEASWEKLHQQDAEAQEDEQPGDLTDAPSLDPSEARGVHVELRYQKASYTALLLRDPEDESVPAPEGFTALPLLLVRMPAALRDSFTSYIASTFDARVAPMKLRSRFLSASLETILSHLDATASTSFSSASPLPSILSRLQLQLSFPAACPTAALRALDITLSRNDIPELLRRGTALLPTTNNNITGPFTAALSHYLRTHLALDLAHPGVHISKIALPPLLALSADGRLKLFSPHTAATAAPADSSTAAISVAGLKRVVDAFYTALLRAARAAPVAEGVSAGAGAGGEETMVLAFRKGKGKEKEKQKQPEKATKTTTAKPSSSSKKGKKRALGEGDANAVGGGGGRGRRKAEASPGKKRRRQQQQPGRVGGDAREEEEEVDEEEEMVGGSSSQRQKTTAASSRGGSLSVPQEPPPPYELHDPAIVR
ncbi:hypothetical protein BFW01_g9248 [Lasiodiplodia theobromae]|uniref:Siroheme synthase n=1 Tax=Lasiodiplodia theobromae TaxID=45133 RepID=UPI0015C3F0EE|nr:Siroheme synthase [Lasiodiplodia theobromae]KAF4539323.1 Siroheme synthase [Lasiodiplodia theobromae]KAF9638351.1 hypothetical protein BFW01_g9248 [Lasiodiplodia theobromae]